MPSLSLLLSLSKSTSSLTTNLLSIALLPQLSLSYRLQQLQQEGPDGQLREGRGHVPLQHARGQGALWRPEVWQRLCGRGGGVRLRRAGGESSVGSAATMATKQFLFLDASYAKSEEAFCKPKPPNKSLLIALCHL